MYNRGVLATGTIQVVDAPEGFLRRPEFQPCLAGGVWLPQDPFFARPPEGSAGPPGSPWAPSPAVRAALFRSVAERWRLPLSTRSRENLARLEDPSATLVITGHQPAFLTGPLYSIYKAISAIAAARRLEEATGRPHLPVFWVASEDHDLDEARAASFPGPGGSSVEFALPHAADRRPLSAYPVDRQAEEVIEAAVNHLSGRRWSGPAGEIPRLYRGRDLAGG